MNDFVHTAKKVEADDIASYGSGSGSRAAGARTAGRGGRRVAPAGATRSALAAARRAANAPGRGRRSRQAILREMEEASRRGRGPARLTNAQIASFRARLRG